MKKHVGMFLILLIVPLINLKGTTKNIRCSVLFNKYGIDARIKSYRGWLRVCNNNKITLYTKTILSKEDKDIICECFEDTDKNRDIYLNGVQE